MSIRRFYMPPEMAAHPVPRITGSDAGHIFRVLRLSPGDTVELVDGAGTGYRARILSVSAKAVEVVIEADFPLMTESPVHITLAMGMLKDRKADELIPPLTELGINRIMPFYAKRSISTRSGPMP
ncbi:RsmE family RNA methyltransferase [Desulfosarcina sp. OttesenSCG-928-G10]|nr:RsmE family RNA methyltransferase [Desulfosarcina sp. OttesenSCG-928-G10]